MDDGYPDGSSINIASNCDVPKTTTKDEVRANDALTQNEANEEQPGVHEKAVYEDLVHLEDAMFDITRQALVQETSMVG